MQTNHAYPRIQKKIERDECIILDGAIATELQRHELQGFKLSDDNHWGFDALHRSPEAVQGVHRQYLASGADILTTNTYSILDAPTYTGHYDAHVGPIHWMELARLAIELPRDVVASGDPGRAGAVAFSIGGEIETPDHLTTIDLLLKIFRDTPPDLVLFETISLIEDNLTMKAIQRVLDSGVPVWASFRRCRKGVCGIHGQLWGGPEGDRFGRLAQSLERMGVGALLINCLPVNRVEGTLPWLRDFCNLPLGIYPNIGRYIESNWQFDQKMRPEDYAEMAREWRNEGAQIIGGCCGVGPDEIKLVAESLNGAPRGGTDRKPRPDSDRHGHPPATPRAAQWVDGRGRELYPLPLPKIVVDEGVFVPTQGSYLIWKYLFNNAIGEHKSCLDIGCGVGILAIQLALNGARDVTAIDILPEAVDNTMTNAFRNGVANKMTAVAGDLYSFLPEEKYDIIVASLYQMPTNPKGQFRGHRDIDYWGRNLFDHFIKNLDNYLDEEGTAYLMQVSMLGKKRTEDLLSRYGYQYRVVDFNLYQFNPVFSENLEQIETVESLSDAYHFKYREDEHIMVMYLLEIRKG